MSENNIGSNIKRLRIENKMTQKALADRLFVSAQAVSRWENGEVEPSISTVAELAKIFEVSADEILGIGEYKTPEPEVIVEKEYVYKEPPKQVISICKICNRPIYEGEVIKRDKDSGIICKECYDSEKEKQRQKEKREKEHDQNERIDKAYSRRSMSWWLGGLAALAAILVWALGAKGYTDFGVFGIVVGVIFPISMFTYVSCCLLANNFIGGLSLEVFSWGFVTLPGIIFEFSIDGCLGFIALKILFFVISIALMVVAAVAAILIGGVISLFVYPFAITKNFKHPEETRLKGDN